LPGIPAIPASCIPAVKRAHTIEPLPDFNVKKKDNFPSYLQLSCFGAQGRYLTVLAITMVSFSKLYFVKVLKRNVIRKASGYYDNP